MEKIKGIMVPAGQQYSEKWPPSDSRAKISESSQKHYTVILKAQIQFSGHGLY